MAMLRALRLLVKSPEMPKEPASLGLFPLAGLPLDILVQVLDYLGPYDFLSLLRGNTIPADALTARHISAKDRKWNTILHLISGLGRKEWTDSIACRSPNVSSGNINGETPLHIAAKHGSEANVQLLIDAGAALSAQCDWGDEVVRLTGATPLLFASLKGHETIMRILIRNGADVAQEDTDGMQPLHWAAHAGRTNAIQLLLDSGADISSMARQWSALHLAASAGNYNSAALLIKNGADLSLARAETGLIPLYYAVAGGHVSLVELLLSAGNKAHVTAESELGVSSLHAAAGGGLWKTWDACTLSVRTYFGGCAKSKASLNPQELATYDKILEILIRENIDVSTPCGHYGVTALHLAAFYGRERAVRMLLEAGADRSLRTIAGWTAGTLALANKHYGVCKLLGEPLPWLFWRKIPLLFRIFRS